MNPNKNVNTPHGGNQPVPGERGDDKSRQQQPAPGRRGDDQRPQRDDKGGGGQKTPDNR
jgi:hypothetical protein